MVAVLFTALILERRMHRIDELRYSTLPIAIVVGGLAGLILLQPDFGTAMSLLLIVAAMVFAAGLNYRYLVGTLLVALPTIYVVLMSADYRRRRLLAFWDPWADPQGDGFQIIQSLLAVGSGGVFGRGLMSGVQKLYYLPEPHTDFIYAVLAENAGFVGCMLVLLAYVVLISRLITGARRASDRMGMLFIMAFVGGLTFQVFINIGMALGISPVIGVPLPLMSAGLASLIATFIAIGFAISVQLRRFVN